MRAVGILINFQTHAACTMQYQDKSSSDGYMIVAVATFVKCSLVNYDSSVTVNLVQCSIKYKSVYEYEYPDPLYPVLYLHAPVL